MQDRFKDTTAARFVLGAVNSRPDDAYDLWVDSAEAARRFTTGDRRQAADYCRKLAELMSLLRGLSRWRNTIAWERGISPTELRADNRSLPSQTYSELIRFEGKARADAMRRIEELARDCPPMGIKLNGPNAGPQPLRFPNDYNAPSFDECLRVFAIETLERRCYVEQCALDECRRFFVEDRNISSAEAAPSFCGKRCRQRSVYLRNVARDPDYYRRAQRRSREARRPPAKVSETATR